MKIITSWDDGHMLDMKLADMLKEFNMPGIFFIPTLDSTLTVDEIQYLADNFEIGGHTTSHPADIKRLSNKEVRADIGDNKKWLEYVTGKEVNWFCYPRGRYNENTIQAVKDCGFTRARTTQIHHLEKAEDPFRIHTAVHVFQGRSEYKGSWLDDALHQYSLAKNSENSYYHIWGHSWEIERQNTWSQLRELFTRIYADENNRSHNHSSKT